MKKRKAYKIKMSVTVGDILLVVLSQMLSLPWMRQLPPIQHLQVVSASPEVVDDLVRSFLIWAQLLLCRVSDGKCYSSQEQLPFIKASWHYLPIVVPSHEVLILSQPLLYTCSDLVQQVQVDAQFIDVALFIVVIHSGAGKSYLCWYHNFSAKRRFKQNLSGGSPRCCAVGLEDTWELIQPHSFCLFESSFDQFEQGLVRHFYQSISLRMCR